MPMPLQPNASTSALLEAHLSSLTPSNLSFHWEQTTAALQREARIFRESRDHRCSSSTSVAAPMTYQHEMRHDDAQQVLARYLEVKNFVSIFAPLRDDTFLTLGLQNASVRSGIRCAVPPSDNRSSSSTWLVQRTPQLIGHGGYDWHFLRGIDIFGTRELVARHGTLWIDAVVVWPIGDDGQVLDNPPVHIHHAFLGPYAFGFASTRHLPSFLHPLHLPHGDTPCDREAGGVDCYLFRFPYGHAIRVDQTLGLNFEGILNDVRPGGLAAAAIPPGDGRALCDGSAAARGGSQVRGARLQLPPEPARGGGGATADAGGDCASALSR